MVWWQFNREVAAGADFCRGGSVPLAEQMIDLQQWLDNIGLGQYADLFAKNDIDHEVLQELDEQDLASLGVSFGHRKKLLKATAEYRCATPGASQRLDEVRRIVDAAGVKPERRHLTVLFCDIVGSTALSARLDPEDLRDILHGFQSCCGDAIRRYEGHIARFMGDGVLAYFGFPTAHEDDAERAVNAALRMVECVSVSASAMPAAHRIEIRIGIARPVWWWSGISLERARRVNSPSSAKRRTWRHRCNNSPSRTRYWSLRRLGVCLVVCSSSRISATTASKGSTSRFASVGF